MRTTFHAGYRPTHVRIFDSVEEAIATVKQIPKSRVEARQVGGYMTGVELSAFKAKFTGRAFSDWSEVYQAAREPWPEGQQIVERMLAAVADAKLPKPVSRRRRPRFNENDGDEVDYDRLRTGRAFWRETRRQNTRGPQTVTVIIDVNAAAGVSHTDILWRGAAAISLTQMIEAADYRVELWVVHCADEAYGPTKAHPHKTGHCTAIRLKRPGDRLDTATFVSAVSGWFYRSLLFRAKAIDQRPRKGLGRPRCPMDRELDELSRDPQRIVISGTYNEYGAARLMREALRKLRGEERPKPEPPKQTTPSEPVKPLTAAERQKALRVFRRWQKEWEKQNHETV